MSDAAGLQNYVSTITSTLAIVISSLTLGWTIYRDAIRKPKLRVDIAVKSIFQAGHEPDGPYVFVEALNMGPVPNRIGLTFLRKNWIKRRLLDRKHGSAMVYPDYHHWATTKASTRLEIGDQATFVFPYDKDSFLKDHFSRVGVADGFGRIHWSSRSDFRRAKLKQIIVRIFLNSFVGEKMVMITAVSFASVLFEARRLVGSKRNPYLREQEVA